MNDDDGFNPSVKVSRWLMAVFSLFVAVLAAGLGYFVHDRLRVERLTVEDNLRSVAELKVSQLVAWKQERMADAVVVSNLPGLAETLTQMYTAPGSVSPRLEQIENYLNALLRAYSYRGIQLLDRSLRPVRGYPADRVLGGVMSPRNREELIRDNNRGDRAEPPLFEDLQVDETGLVSMCMLVRIRSASGEFVGVAVITIAAESVLFPHLQSWPVESATAETLLVRLEGDSILYLTPLRHQPGAVMKLRLPLAQPELLAANVMRTGRGGLVHGKDYRGASVVGVALPVPDTPWVIVAKMDQTEAYAKMWKQFWQLSVAGLFLLLVLILLGRIWLHFRQVKHINLRLESEHKRRVAAEQLAIVMRYANDIIFRFDESMRIVDANERAIAAYGYNEQELRQLTAHDLRTTEEGSKVQRDFIAALNEEGVGFDTEHRRKDGTVFPVEVSSRAVVIEGRRYVLSIVRDITERRRLTEALARQEARFRYVFDHMPVGISLSSPAGIELVNPAHARITGVTAAASRDHVVFARATLPEDYARQQTAAEQFNKGVADHYTVEKRYRHPDGSLQWAELTSRRFIDPLTGEGKIVTTLIDLAQRKAQEQEIERLNRVYYVISQVNQALVRVKTRDELFREVCRVLVEIGRFRIAWVGWLNPETKLIDPVAVAGDTHDYVAGIRISSDAAVPEGRGPSGTAFREGRTYVCNDFFANPATAPWRERAARSGFQSTIAIPLCCEGRILGLLTVYAEEKEYFAPREIELLEESAGDMSFALDVFAGEDRRRDAENSLRQSEARLNFLVSSTPSVIYTFNATGAPAVTFISANVARLTGYDARDFLADPSFWAEHLHPDDRGQAFAAMARLADQDSILREYRFRHQDGSYRWTLDEIRLVRDAAGRQSEYIGSWIDINDRKHTEEELARQQARFRVIFEHAPVGISLVLENGEVLANEEHARITGVPVKDSNIPGIFARASHPDDYARQLVAALPYHRNELDSYAIDKRYLHPDGRTVWARLSSHWFLDPSTRQKQSLTIISDISEQKKSEEEVKRQAARFQFIFEQLPIGISLRTMAYGLEVNPAHVRLTGVAAADSNLPGVFARVTHPEDYARQLQISESFLQGDTDRFSLEKRYLHPAGRVVWVEFTSIRLIDLGTGEPQTLTTVADITERKAAEEALRNREEIFSNIVGQALDAIALVDVASARFVEFNRSAHESLGYTREEFQNLGITGIQAEHSQDQIRSNIGQILETGSATFVSRHRHRNGELRDVRISARKLTLRGQDYIAAVWSDITEAKRLTQHLQVSEARHRALFENMDLGVIYQDMSGAITAANAAASRISGLSLDQLQGRKSDDPEWHAVHEDGSPYPGETHPAMVALRTGQPVQNVVMGIRTAHAATRWMLINAMPEFRAGESRPFQVFTIFADITERRAVEDELRKLSLAVEQNPASIVITDLKGAIEYVNPRYTEVSGYTREEVLGLNPRILKSGLTPPEVYAELWCTITRGAVWRGEIVNRRKDGELFTELVIITPVKDAQGRPTHYLALKEDITERKQAQMALQTSEAKFRRLLQTMPLPIGYSDKDGRITFSNERFQKIFGYTPQEVPTVQAWWEKVYPDPAYRSALAEQWARAMAAAATGNGEIGTMETNITCKDGQVRTVEISGMLHDNEVLVAFVDITERSRTEKTLRKLSRTIEQAPLSIAITDLSGAIEYVNPRFCEVTGYTLKEVLGQNPRVLKSGNTPAATYTEMWQTLVRGQVWRGELSNKKKNGEIYDENAVIAPVVDDAGNVTHYVALKEDITERKRSETLLREIQERYRIMAENSSDSIWLYDLATERFTYCSPSIFRLLGRTPEEMTTHRISDVLTPESAVEVASFLPDRLTRFAAGDESVRIVINEVDQLHRDGRTIPTEVSTTLLGDATGRVTQILGVTRDITERRQSGETLRRSEELYRLIADNTSDAIWICDLAEGVLTYVSPAVERLLGIPAAELIGQPITVGLTPESAAMVAKVLPTRVAGFQAGDLSMRDSTVLLEYIRRDGSILYGEVVTTLLLDANGRVTRILGVSRDVSERRRAERAITESRNRLAKAEQIARLGNWTLEIATSRVTWSDEMYRLLELDPDTTTPSAELYQSFMTPEDREVLNRRFAEALTKRQRFVLGTRLILQNGRIKYVEGTGEVIFGPEGTPIRAIGTVQDVTERKLVEMELHELVKGLRVLRTISYALQQREKGRDELLALVVHELPSALVFPADARAHIEIDGQRQVAGAEGELLSQLTAPITLNDRVAGAVTVGYVRPHAAADDGPFNVREREILHSLAHTIGLSLGEREAFTSVQRFSSELEGKVAERTTELAARTKQIEALLNAIPDTVMRLGLDGSVLFSQRAQSSPRLAAITPLPAVRPGYQATADLLAACLRLGRLALAENNTVADDIEVGTPGGPIAIELRSAPTGTEEFVMFVRDITARKHLEAEVTAMLVKEREVSEMKTRFISVTSHEFRTPMAAAMGSVELLHNHFDRLTPVKREELFTRVYGSMHRMTEMLDDILTLNRMDANRLEVQPGVIDLRSFVHSAIDEIRLGDREAHRFELSVEGETAGFVADPVLLHHILSNLLSNAVRYSPAGTVVTTHIAAAAERVRITVEDQGIGIPAADRQRIFEPFERGSNAGHIKGTGLGLNIVKRMSELLGGTIGVEPAAGGGSCFMLIFPRLPAPASPP